MDRSTPIYLLAPVYSQNDKGVIGSQFTERMIYANVTSVTGSEWFEGGRAGLNPELRFRVFAPDYQGEEILKYNDHYYSVYRTYMARNDILELYCERRSGTDNPASLIAVGN
jgi:hypothetical protein